MDITVITICLNDLEGLRKTRKSVDEQTIQAYKHIIIDGGSHDGTKMYLETLTGDDAVWVSEPDKGRSDAFNKGISMAKESLIICLNAGDVFKDAHVIEDVLDDWNKCEADVLCYPVVRTDGSIINVSEELWDKGLLAHQGIFISKKVYEELGGYNTFLSNRMDYDFFYRMAKAKVDHKIFERIVSVFDINGITTYGRNNAIIEGAGIKLLYDKTKYLVDVIGELSIVRKDISTSNSFENITIENTNTIKKKLLIQWVRNTQNNKRIADYLLRIGVRFTSIYGCGEIGKLLAGELQGIVITEFIDKKADKLSMEKYPVVAVNDMNPDVDAVIVTTLYDEDSIFEDLKGVFKGRIIHIKSLIDNVSRQ